MPVTTLSSIYSSYAGARAKQMAETKLIIIQIKHNRVKIPNWPFELGTTVNESS